MKIKDVAHDHSLTDLLKVSIFSLLMLAPMINVGVRSAYVICNKNAYQSYSGETNTTETREYDYNELSYNQQYDLVIPADSTVTGTLTIFGDYIKLYRTNNTETDLTGYTKALIYTYSNNTTIELQGTEMTTLYVGASAIVKMSFVYYSYTTSNFSGLDNAFKQVITLPSNYLDNVFEYSVSQLTESPLYNWVENTAIYSGVALMNTQLGITQPVISLLVVYWLLLTIIYVIIDIVIRVFTWLTHMIGSKTA